MDAEGFRQKLTRIIRREHAAHALESGKSYSEIKDRLKKLKTGDLARVVNSLIESTVTVEPRRAAIANELSVMIRKEFPTIKNLAIVLLGSGAHGGAELRKIMENERSSDLDWALIADDDVVQNGSLLVRIESVVKRNIGDLGKKHGFEDDFHSCMAYNGVNCHMRAFASPQDALLFMESDAMDSSFEEFLYFFQPSFPSEVGRKNRENIINALQILAKNDNHRWQLLTEGLIRMWRNIHTIKSKHIELPIKKYGADYRKKTRELRHELLQDSGQVMSEPFEHLIRSTGNS